MTLVDEAFMNLKRKLEITQTQQEEASRTHIAIRGHLNENLDLEKTFLTGSYARHTKTKKLKDVDIFCVVKLDGTDAGLRQKEPASVLNSVQAILKKKYDTVKLGRRACTIFVGDEGEGEDDAEDIVSFDVVPAFVRKAGGYEIPDRISGKWVATDPTVHQERATAKNAACKQMWIPFVKMLKGWNREAGKPVSPSFLLEVMALDIVEEPFTTYQQEFRHFLATAAEQIGDVWPDPSGLGPDVNMSMGASEKVAAAAALSAALKVAENAIFLEQRGKYRDAVEEWRKLFGWRMPRP